MWKLHYTDTLFLQREYLFDELNEMFEFLKDKNIKMFSAMYVKKAIDIDKDNK